MCGVKQLPLHTHDVDRQWFAQNSQMNRTELILKIVYWSAITLAAILKTRSARRLARCLLPAFLCAHIERDVWVRGRLITAKATSSTRRPQTCTEVATKYYNYTANKPVKRGNTECQRFKKRWGDQATHEVFNQNYLLQCNDRQQELHDRTMHGKNIFPTDLRQSISL